MQKLSILFFILLSFNVFAQEQNDFSYKLSGFVKSDYWLDSRQVTHAREGLFLFIPTDRKLDIFGKDINNGWNINFSAITSRLILDLKAKEAFGAKSSGYIEADFSGASNAATNNFRLRHAWIKLDWKKSQLLLGQTWNPIFTTDCYPTILSLNTGAPFQPFIRNPQIAFTRHFGKFDLLAAAITQRDNANISDTLGLIRDYAPLSNSGLPNLHLQLKLRTEHHFAGIGADYKWLKPSLSIINIKSNSTIGSYAFLAYYRFKGKKSDFKIKAIYGQNLNENLLLGGYGVHSINNNTAEYTYTPTNHLFVWTNFTKTIKTEKFDWQPFIFLGYIKNFGTSKSLYSTQYFYAMGRNIDKMYRGAAGLNLKSGNVTFSMEYEYTAAKFGTIELSTGLVKNTHLIANNRLLFTGYYFF